nr:MAG TPA: hypothetical protein [Caudoviricetes sp.]
MVLWQVMSVYFRAIRIFVFPQLFIIALKCRHRQH